VHAAEVIRGGEMNGEAVNENGGGGVEQGGRWTEEEEGELSARFDARLGDWLRLRARQVPRDRKSRVTGRLDWSARRLAWARAEEDFGPRGRGGREEEGVWAKGEGDFGPRAFS
jgi:hypothetical protein